MNFSNWRLHYQPGSLLLQPSLTQLHPAGSSCSDATGHPSPSTWNCPDLASTQISEAAAHSTLAPLPTGSGQASNCICEKNKCNSVQFISLSPPRNPQAGEVRKEQILPVTCSEALAQDCPPGLVRSNTQ